MRVLAIDPGYDRCGIAVVEKKEGGKESLLYSDCFATQRSSPFSERLASIGDEIARLIDKYGPDVLAFEDLFFNTNQKTAMRVAEVRGVIRYLAKSGGLELYEYTPLQVKIAITGYGHSDKKQVIDMLPRLIDIKKEVKYDDEYDAIGVALTCHASLKHHTKRR